MILKFVSIASLVFFTTSAFAIDTARCPVEIMVGGQVTKVHKSSQYSKLPGWKEAQQTLLANPVVNDGFSLASNKNGSCFYTSESGNTAVLSTASFNDPEEHDPSLVDQLILNFKIERSSYVSYLAVKSYGRRFIDTNSRPYPLKIKARLQAPNGQLVNIDMGMISLVVE